MQPEMWGEGPKQKDKVQKCLHREGHENTPSAPAGTSGGFEWGLAIGEGANGSGVSSRSPGPFGQSSSVDGDGHDQRHRRKKATLVAKRGGSWQKGGPETGSGPCWAGAGLGAAQRDCPSTSKGRVAGAPGVVKSDFESGWASRPREGAGPKLFAFSTSPGHGGGAFAAKSRSDAPDGPREGGESGASFSLPSSRGHGRRGGGDPKMGGGLDRPIMYTPAPLRNGREQPEYRPPVDIGPPSPTTSMAEEQGEESDMSGAADMFAPVQPPAGGTGRGWFSLGGLGGGKPPSLEVARVRKAPAPRMNILADHLGELEIGELTAEGLDLSHNVESLLSLGSAPCGEGGSKGPAMGGAQVEGDGRRHPGEGAGGGPEGDEKAGEFGCEHFGKRQKLKYPGDAQNRWSGSEAGSPPAERGMDLPHRAPGDSVGAQHQENRATGWGQARGPSPTPLANEAPSEVEVKDAAPSLTSRIYNGVYKFVFGSAEGAQQGTGPTAAGRLAGRKVAPKSEGSRVAEDSEAPQFVAGGPKSSLFFQAGESTGIGRSGGFSGTFCNAASSSSHTETRGNSAPGRFPDIQSWAGVDSNHTSDHGRGQNSIFMFKGGANTAPTVAGRKQTRATSMTPGSSDGARLRARRRKSTPGGQVECPSTVPLAAKVTPMMWSPAQTPVLPRDEKGKQNWLGGPTPMSTQMPQPSLQEKPMADTPMSVFPSGNAANCATPMSMMAEETQGRIWQNPSQGTSSGVPFDCPMSLCTPVGVQTDDPGKAQDRMHPKRATEPLVHPLTEMLWTPRDKKSGNKFGEMSSASCRGVSEEPASSWPSADLSRPSFQGMGRMEWPSSNLVSSGVGQESPMSSQRKCLRAKKGRQQLKNQLPNQNQAGASSTAPGGPQSEEQILQAGEAHKRRGNDFFSKAKYVEAEAQYTQALDLLKSLPKCVHLAPLFCNRAAAWLMTSSPKRALKDCQCALEVDKTYARAYIRGTTCQLRLGNFAAAKEMLGSAKLNVPSNCGQYLEVAPKLTEVEQLESQFQRVKSHLMQGEVLEAGLRGGLQELEGMEKELSHSEEMWALKVLCLLRVGDHGRVTPILDCVCKSLDIRPPRTLWWQWIALQAWFHDGKQDEVSRRLTELISTLEQQPEEAMACPTGFTIRPNLQELKDIAKVEADANQLKLEGNEWYRNKNFKKAIELYAKALTTCKQGAVSGRFLAILLSNRAAAHQGAGAYAEAIADCCMARALDTTFVRAQVRLATLLLEIVRPQAAVDVLQRVIDFGNVDHSEVRDLMRRLAEAQVSAVKDPTPDHFKLLGLQATCKMDELKKAYRQLAVRLHPDKAALNCPYSLRFGPSGVKVLGESKVLDTIKEEASWLFKLINEANDAITNDLKHKKLERELFGDEVRRGYNTAGNRSRHDGPIFGYARNNTYRQSQRAGFQNQHGYYTRSGGYAPDAFSGRSGWNANRGF
ncbi:unnamed protein product [Ostreobium quekettii]|uniref:J domain-containing protein n=1 Tax=Ostreobium quekettii TaxID=121088 RepID=A0A8S1IQF4_9CHLO|nr:unnamed protein product [Ostreobium quekettii]